MLTENIENNTKCQLSSTWQKHTTNTNKYFRYYEFNI